MGRFGNNMKNILMLALFATSVATKAFCVVVQLPRVEIQGDGTDIMVVTDATNRYELPTPQDMLGETCVDMRDKVAVIEKAKTVVAASIVEVVPIAITALRGWYDQSDPSGPLFWYRIKCEIKDTIRGNFPFSDLEFVATYGGDRLYWPFVRGYSYYFIMDEREGGWIITSKYRTCPLPPYKLEDHVSYYGMKRTNPNFDWSQSDEIIKKAEEQEGKKCRDVSFEKNKYLIMTFAGKDLWGGLNIDYGKSVVIVTNEWSPTLLNGEQN